MTMDAVHLMLLTTLVVVVITIVLLIVVARQVVANRRELAELREAANLALREDGGDGSGGASRPRVPARVRKVTVVMNPTKHSDPERFRKRLRTVVDAIHDTSLTCLDTTPEDPGHGQTLQAMRDGADLVIAAGGDGTVRMVASALAGSDVRMGIIPVGTGNLLARNLELPLDDVERALLTAITGKDRRIDVGWLQAGMSQEEADAAPRRIFLVMSGYGADAQMIGYTDPQLKKRVGWIAYVFGGIRTIVGRSHDVVVSLPGGSSFALKARTVLIGNVGKLPGGLVLMPGATIDNGRLEVLVAAWRGAAGFSQIVTQIVNPRIVARPRLSTMERYLTEAVHVAATKPQPVQLDGDTEDAATHLVASVDAGALMIRTPGRG